METLLRRIRNCTECADSLPHGTRPVLQASKSARILIAGQAPGRRVHESGVPFDDPSGDRLRDWLGLSKTVFYDPSQVAIIPMSFCYPGTGSSGDLPPRPECAALWHENLLSQMQAVELRVVIGRYAIDWHLPHQTGRAITSVVQDWQSHLPDTIVLPHPSPRNNIWLKKNPWFATDVLPALRQRVHEVLGAD